MRADQPTPVKYFIGALFSDKELLEQAFEQCVGEIGELGFRSQEFLFNCTDYYDTEMGGPIQRMFIGIQQIQSPGELARFKNICNTIEDNLRVAGKRKVNLDIGYLDLHKVILASAKYNGQKIYLGDGIYADPTLVFESGAFQPLANTFPDFKDGQYNKVFATLRNCYKSQLKTAR